MPADREAKMVSKPKVTPAEHISAFNPNLIWGLHCPATDPAVGWFEQTEFFLEQDKPTQNKMMAVRLEAEANLHKAIADGHSKMAGLLKTNG
jgi:hypothetical protein